MIAWFLDSELSTCFFLNLILIMMCFCVNYFGHKKTGPACEEIHPRNMSGPLGGQDSHSGKPCIIILSTRIVIVMMSKNII